MKQNKMVQRETKTVLDNMNFVKSQANRWIAGSAH